MTFVRGKSGSNFRNSVMMPSKGLLNNPGENNCFMNSAVQVLWHLDVFRRSFRLLQGHACLEECCIFCGLKDIFEKFQASNEDALPPDVLRNAMAKAFQDERKFQIGRMDDAAECFENILRRLHFHIAYEEAEDMCNAKHCISHQKFAMQILEQTSCKCGATSEPLNFFQIVNYVSASALINKAREPLRDGSQPFKSFGELLKRTLALGEKQPCPDDKRCMYKERNIPPTKMHRTLLNSPDIAGIGIIWDTDRPSVDYIMDLLNCLGQKLELKHIFDNVSDDKARKMKLRLVGIMTYYGKHYTTFFYNTRQKSWFYFDDAKVKEIGEDWDLVKLKCKRGRFQPLLALYANPDGEPIQHLRASKTVKVVTEAELQQLHLQNNDIEEVEVKRKGQHERPVKRKSFKKMMGSAFKKSRRKQGKYSLNHVDMVLSVNGKNTKETSESESEMITNNQSYNDISYDYDDDDRHADAPNQRMSTNVKELVIDSPRKSTDSNEGSSRRKSNDERTTRVRSAQTDLLFKHKRHLSSIEINTDRQSEASDYDNLESPRSLKESRKISSDHQNETVFMDEKVPSKSKKSPKRSPEKEKTSPNIGRNFEIQDKFDYAVNTAERIFESSFAAEKEGHLIEAFQLCTDANRRYRAAVDIPGLTVRMVQYADRKRWEAHERSRILNSKIEYGRERLSKSADYLSRGISKTSDYGSLSETSCSPVTPDFVEVVPNVSSKFTMSNTTRKENEGLNDVKKVVQNKETAKTKEENSAQETGDVLQPSSREMEQLSALLKDFEVSQDVPASKNQNITKEISETQAHKKHAPEVSNAGNSFQAHDTPPQRKYSGVNFIVTKFVDSKDIPIASHAGRRSLAEQLQDRLRVSESASKPERRVGNQGGVEENKNIDLQKDGDFVCETKDSRGRVQIQQKRTITNGRAFLVSRRSDDDNGHMNSYRQQLRISGSKLLQNDNSARANQNTKRQINEPTKTSRYNIYDKEINYGNKICEQNASSKTERRNYEPITVHVNKEIVNANPSDFSSSSTAAPVRKIVTSSNYQNYQSNQTRSPISVKKQINKWSLEDNFAHSPRQMCEQCGTVTVEKPKRFCSKCQSDYL